MKYFRKVWSQELNAWLLTTKGMNPNEAYSLFLKTFPEITDVTRIAFNNQRSRMGAAGESRNKGSSTKIRPLYSEQVKKGYVRIKIAQPNVWMMKAKWVYMETHPWEDCSERSNYVFLDGNSRNFNPDNIVRVPLKLMGVFCKLGGSKEKNPDITRLRIAQAKLKLALLDAGERTGSVCNNGTHNGRVFKEERNRRAKEYYSNPEKKAVIKESHKRYMERLKANPVRYAEYRRKVREQYKRRMDKLRG